MKDEMVISEIEHEAKYHEEQIRVVFKNRHAPGTHFHHTMYVIREEILSLRALRHKAKYAGIVRPTLLAADKCRVNGEHDFIPNSVIADAEFCTYCGICR